jgi:hypothetical protein
LKRGIGFEMEANFPKMDKQTGESYSFDQLMGVNRQMRMQMKMVG